MRILNSEEMKLVEQYSAKYGLTYQRMMENAGAACTRNIKAILERKNISGKKMIVICGKGNNGGDGFVIARKFAESGYNVCVLLSSGYPTSAESTYMYKLALDSSVPTVWFDADKAKALQTIKNAEIIVDAVFGFSFYGELSEEMKELFAAINKSSATVFSVDLPSGVYCDSGCSAEGCINADYTIAISSLKPSHIIKPACEYCGDIVVANIGIPEESYDIVGNTLYTYEKTEIGSFFTKRKSTAHKGDFGHLLCICSSKNMPGAAVMCAQAALRSGAGLVTVAFPESVYIPVSAKLTEALLLPLAETVEGTVSVAAISSLSENIHKYSAVVVGCGLGVNEDTRALVKWLVKNVKVPLIIDADGINSLASNTALLENRSNPIVITPHFKEMSRLCGVDTKLIAADPVSYSRDFSHKYNVTVVLKGANTVVARPGTDKVYINATGNNGLSKGGSGDVLAGLISGLCAQDFSSYSAAVSGVYIHGLAADITAEKYSAMGMLPSDVVDEFRSIFRFFEK